jgi:MerR family transcriptional regulator, copper efflux regulator
LHVPRCHRGVGEQPIECAGIRPTIEAQPDEGALAVEMRLQIQRMIATGFTIDDIRGFPDCMLLIEGARSCDQITDVQRQRLEAIDRQIADLERRRARLIKTLSEGAVPPVD